jgi:hypothetical protein
MSINAASILLTLSLLRSTSLFPACRREGNVIFYPLCKAEGRPAQRNRGESTGDMLYSKIKISYFSSHEKSHSNALRSQCPALAAAS